MTTAQINFILQLAPLLAADIQQAIFALFRAPAMTDTELAAAAAKIDEDTLDYINAQIAAAGGTVESASGIDPHS